MHPADLAVGLAHHSGRPIASALSPAGVAETDPRLHRRRSICATSRWSATTPAAALCQFLDRRPSRPHRQAGADQLRCVRQVPAVPVQRRLRADAGPPASIRLLSALMRSRRCAIRRSATGCCPRSRRGTDRVVGRSRAGTDPRIAGDLATLLRAVGRIDLTDVATAAAAVHQAGHDWCGAWPTAASPPRWADGWPRCSRTRRWSRCRVRARSSRWMPGAVVDAIATVNGARTAS